MISMVPPGLVPVLWAQVKDLLAPAIALSDGEVTEESAFNRLVTGATGLVVISSPQGAITMAFTLEVVVFESGKRELAIPLMGGSGLDDLSTDFMPYVEKKAREANCPTITGYAARKGWTRKLKLYGWNSVREIIKHEVSI